MSNLLDKASIVLTPTAYNNGEALCVKPSDGSGDFDFSRNSAATRVNAQGLVENVQILSSNLVQNGDFSEEGAEEVSNGSFSQEGAELVTNGSFDTDSDWSKVNATISGGTGNLDSTSGTSLLFQSALVVGKTYKAILDVTNYNGLGTCALINSNGDIQFEITSNGNKEFYFTQGGSSSNLSFRAINGGIFSIDNVSVREVGQDWVLGTGWSIGEDKATVDNTVNASLDQTCLTSGKTYKVSFEISDLQVGGNITVGDIVTPSAYTATSNGLHTFYYTATNSTLRSRGKGYPCSITNISVKEVGQNWTFDANWSIGEDKAISDGTQGYIVQTDVGGAGVTATYKIQWEQNITAGTRLRFFARNYNDGGNATILSITRDDGLIIGGGNCIGSGTFTAYVSSTNGYSFKLLAEAGVEADITNITTIQITTDTNLPRINYEGFSYDGSGNVVPDSGCGSWLFEPQSTNLIPNANQYAGNTVYYTVTSNQSSPDGENNATLFVEKTSTSPYTVNSINASVVGGQTYSYSFFVKYAGKQNIPVNATDGVSGFLANIDILNGTVNSGTAEIKDFGNGWYRVSMTRAVAASATNASIQFNFGTQTGDGTSGFYLFGYQVEQQSYATSYIPTDGTTVTRNQDVCTNGGSLASINSTEGVLYAEIAALNETASYSQFISISDGTYNNRASILFSSGSTNQIRTFLRVGGTAQIDVSNVVADVTSFNKVAFSYKENDFKVYINGSLASSDTSGSVWSADTITKLSFSEINTSAGKFEGKTKAVVVYKEALSDSELQELTTI